MVEILHKDIITVSEVDLFAGVECVALSESALHTVCDGEIGREVGDVVVLAGGIHAGAKVCISHFHDFKVVRDSLGLTCGATRVEVSRHFFGVRVTSSTRGFLSLRIVSQVSASAGASSGH